MSDLLTRVTIWLALGLFAAAQIERRRAAPATSMTGRWLFSVGCSLYLAHVVLAFDVHYGWSHAIAYAETAIQTEAFTGLRWGLGIYVSYLFSAIWVGETAWWWLAPEGYHTRVHRLDLAMRAFFLFMILNGAVVFVSGPQRLLGVAIVVVLLVAWRPTQR